MYNMFDGTGSLSVYSVFDGDHKEPKPICVIFIFVKAAKNTRLQDAFRTTASSLFRHASVPLDIYIIGDEAGKDLGEDIIKESSSNMIHPYKVYALCKKAKCEHIIPLISPYRRRRRNGGRYKCRLMATQITIHITRRSRLKVKQTQQLFISLITFTDCVYSRNT